MTRNYIIVQAERHSWTVGACLLGLTLLLGNSQAQTLTRTQVNQMSPKELAARVLEDLAATGTAKELKFYISPVAPTPPWLQQVAVDLPKTYQGPSVSLCVANRVTVDFAPLDPDAQKHMFDASYDPPARIVGIETTQRYADASGPTCDQIPDMSYFGAPTEDDAIAAAQAFHLFRANPGLATCVDVTNRGECKELTAQSVTAFTQVISKLDDWQANGTVLRTIVLALPGNIYHTRELWLRLEFHTGLTLKSAELRNRWGPPIP